MKISENWLRTWVNPDISTDELVATLTMAGLEVDGTEELGAELAGILVGQIDEEKVISRPTPHKTISKLRKPLGHSFCIGNNLCGILL